VIVVIILTVIVNVISMNNQEKAVIYDNCIRESDRLQREISIIKSEYGINLPQEIQEDIKEREERLELLRKRLENLFR
jgi:hypothetical protein